VNDFRAVPGGGFYKVFKGDQSAYDYFDGRGYVTFNATKYIDFQLGYDKNFIGNGYRSLFLSDWGNSYLFAKINTRIWKFNYQNLFMELMPQFTKNGDTLLTRKYAAMHHLSMNVNPWLNVGLFEGVIFGRKDHFDFQYLNPIIFYRHIEGSVGDKINIPEVLLIDNDGKLTVGKDVKEKVSAEIISEVQGDKVIAFKMKRRKGFRKKIGHRKLYTKIMIDSIA
jgi:ribosomal protein L21